MEQSKDGDKQKIIDTGVIPAETNRTFKLSGTLWNKICNDLGQGWQQKGIPDLPQWFFHDLTRSPLSNKLYYAFKRGEPFQAWMHCSFVPGTLCQWSHGEALRPQPRSKHWLWWDISTWLPSQWLLLEHCSPRPSSIKSDSGTTPTSPEPSTLGICASQWWYGVPQNAPNPAELFLPFLPGSAFSSLWFWEQLMLLASAWNASKCSEWWELMFYQPGSYEMPQLISKETI